VLLLRGSLLKNEADKTNAVHCTVVVMLCRTLYLVYDLDTIKCDGEIPAPTRLDARVGMMEQFVHDLTVEHVCQLPVGDFGFGWWRSAPGVLGVLSQLFRGEGSNDVVCDGEVMGHTYRSPLVVVAAWGLATSLANSHVGILREEPTAVGAEVSIKGPDARGCVCG
jgi:hypothetical protein